MSGNTEPISYIVNRHNSQILSAISGVPFHTDKDIAKTDSIGFDSPTGHGSLWVFFIPVHLTLSSKGCIFEIVNRNQI